MKTRKSFVVLALLAAVLSFSAVAYNGDPQCGSYENPCICADSDEDCRDVWGDG